MTNKKLSYIQENNNKEIANEYHNQDTHKQGWDENELLPHKDDFEPGGSNING